MDENHLTSERSDQSLQLSGNNYTIAEDSKEEDISFATPNNVFGGPVLTVSELEKDSVKPYQSLTNKAILIDEELVNEISNNKAFETTLNGKKGDFIKIDDSQFVTLSQIVKDDSREKNLRDYYSERFNQAPSTLSNYVNQ